MRKYSQSHGNSGLEDGFKKTTRILMGFSTRSLEARDHALDKGKRRPFLEMMMCR